MKTGNLKIGILGGGQLGKMLTLEAQNWDLSTWVLDSSRSYPAGNSCTFFIEGDFKNYDDVYSFGKLVDVLTIEIEHVNTDALLQLEKEGLKIHPSPGALTIIKDKGSQKEFFKKHQLPTAPFQLWDNTGQIRSALSAAELAFPFVQKTRTAGYDGRGVTVILSGTDLDKLLEGPSLTEDLVEFEKEIAVIVSRNENGNIATFPPVEMEFNPDENLVEFIKCPAEISELLIREAINLAKATIEAFNICGLLAVEMFLTRNHKLLINEVAPRPHNSGHHTLDNCYTSQFEQHLRAILNLPLGSTKMKSPAVMVNLLGEPGYSGPVRYSGWEECLGIEGAKVHLYAKTVTKPYRKMGHVTVLAENCEKAMEKAHLVKKVLKVIA